MRFFSDPIEMIKEVERDLYEMGIVVQSHSVQDIIVEDKPEFFTKELFGYGYTLTDFTEEKLKKMIEYMKGNYNWAVNEFMDRIAVKLINPGNTWMIDRKLWEKYIRFGKFQYTYNQRMRPQLPIIIEELKNHPFTRQAIITIYDQHMDIDNLGGKARIPCSIYYQFLYRQNKLNMIYTMRSCDFLNHFATDVYMAIKILTYVCMCLGAEPGNFTHFIGSIHAFKKDLDERGIF